MLACPMWVAKKDRGIFPGGDVKAVKFPTGKGETPSGKPDSTAPAGQLKIHRQFEVFPLWTSRQNTMGFQGISHPGMDQIHTYFASAG